MLPRCLLFKKGN
jgi:hypothetical protein